MSKTYRQKTVLTEAMQRIRFSLGQRLSGTGAGQPKFLFNIHASNFIDPKWIGDDRPNHKMACLEGSVEIALSIGYLRGKVIAVVIDGRDPWVSEQEELCKEWGIDCFVADLESDEERAVQFFIDAWGRRRDQRPPLKPVTNHDENWFRDVLDNATGYILNESQKTAQDILKKMGIRASKPSERYEIFREVALDRLVDILPGDTEEITFARMSSVDLVITHPCPNMLPYLCIEIDGPHHEHPRQKRKDRLKDSILTAAEIPVLRLSLKDRGFKEVRRAGSIIDVNDEREKKEYSKLLESILQKIIDSLYCERKQIPAKWKEYDQANARSLEMLIRKYQIENSRIDIPNEAIEEIIEEAEENCSELMLEAQYTAFDFLTKLTNRSKELANRLGKFITRLNDDEDADGFLSGICCIESDGWQATFTSPRIRLRMIGWHLPILEISFQEIVKTSVREFALEAAYSFLENDR